MISFSGYDWEVKESSTLVGPGPNYFDSKNVRVDSKGRLHLKIAFRNEVWSCAEVHSVKHMGFGSYRFKVIGSLDRLDSNIVFGMFNYPPLEFGSDRDGTNEIDIEYSAWGRKGKTPVGSFGAWPKEKKLVKKRFVHQFPFTLRGTFTTHRFAWKKDCVEFLSLEGHRDDSRNSFQRYLYKPGNWNGFIAQDAMPIHINLWLCQGKKPMDEKEEEIVISEFKWFPL